MLPLLYGSLPPWIGYGIGSEQAQLPHLLLRMPIGFLIGSWCFRCGIWGGILAAKDFSEGHATWCKRLSVALVLC